MKSAMSIRILVAATLLLVSCNSRDKYAVFMEGLQIEGDAEKTVCKLHNAEGQMAPVLSGDQVLTCLRRTEEAIALYEEAGRMGMNDTEYQRIYQRALQRRERLEGMLGTVRDMERGY
jgi:major membrane immunogen (membrane-anchored lipoprotein)